MIDRKKNNHTRKNVCYLRKFFHRFRSKIHIFCRRLVNCRLARRRLVRFCRRFVRFRCIVRFRRFRRRRTRDVRRRLVRFRRIRRRRRRRVRNNRRRYRRVRNRRRRYHHVRIRHRDFCIYFDKKNHEIENVF